MLVRSRFNSLSLIVEFSLKTDSRYPKDKVVTLITMGKPRWESFSL